ncbi:SsrA-binding protein [Shewanella hanedai]|nr:SsrA-binding protein [Shewanella hanedai]
MILHKKQSKAAVFTKNNKLIGNSNSKNFVPEYNSQPMAKKNSKNSSASIARNKRATFDYKFEEKMEAGLSLMGWEVKSIRMGKVNLSESYVFMRDGEAFLFGCTIAPLNTASTHVVCDPMRSRKLLLKRKELDKLQALVDRKGYSIVPISMYWQKGAWVKIEIGLGKGKKEHDKREDTKDREWQVEKARTMKKAVRGE